MTVKIFLDDRKDISQYQNRERITKNAKFLVLNGSQLTSSALCIYKPFN